MNSGLTNGTNKKHAPSLECISVNQKNTVKTLLKCEVIDEKFFFFR